MMHFFFYINLKFAASEWLNWVLESGFGMFGSHSILSVEKQSSTLCKWKEKLSIVNSVQTVISSLAAVVFIRVPSVWNIIKDARLRPCTRPTLTELVPVERRWVVVDLGSVPQTKVFFSYRCCGCCHRRYIFSQ